MKTISSVYKKVRKLLNNGAIRVRFVRSEKEAFLCQVLKNSYKPVFDSDCSKIEMITERTNKLGNMPLWEGYSKDIQTRTPLGVSTRREMGCLYKEIVKKFKPQTIVEFGTAFGVSGMYWLAGLESNAKGELLTFEPNETWAKVAKENLAEIGNRFTLTIGTFEEKIHSFMENGNRSIDIAFIDAIHTREFVLPQLELVLKYCAPHTLIFLDDINFSEDMLMVWKEVSSDKRFIATASLGERVGVLEFRK